MSFSGSQSELIKKWREATCSHKNTPREKPQGVFGVHYCLIAVRSAMQLAASLPSQSSQPRVALVDTSVYLKPTKLLDVAFDMLARLAPCLNLGVGELGHKDLLDTIGADNCRK